LAFFLAVFFFAFFLAFFFAVFFFAVFFFAFFFAFLLAGNFHAPLSFVPWMSLDRHHLVPGVRPIPHGTLVSGRTASVATAARVRATQSQYAMF